MYKYERYKMLQAAKDRWNELLQNGFKASIYHGHREYVVQYWVNANIAKFVGD